jgi:hypothetical protein
MGREEVCNYGKIEGEILNTEGKKNGRYELRRNI